MKSSMMKVVLITALVTGVTVSALAFFAVPRIMNPKSPGMQDAMFNSPSATDQQVPVFHDAQPSQSANVASPAKPTAYHRASAAPATRTYSAAPVRHHRSTEKSVLIVAGSSGAGAAIGALAGGGKGAAIGAIAGGVGGLVYDRMTANK